MSERSDAATQQFVPDAFEKYRDCPDCEVEIHGPRKAGSRGGCRVTLCDEHQRQL